MSERRRYRKDDDGKRHLVVMHDGHEGFVVRWTSHCTGCTDCGDYGVLYGPFGCEECGYTGKRRRSEWVPFDVEAWWKHYDAKWRAENPDVVLPVPEEAA